MKANQKTYKLNHISISEMLPSDLSRSLDEFYSLYLGVLLW